MLCFILSGAFCIVHGETGTETEGDGITIDLIEASSCTEPIRGNSINPTIDGHVLSVVFTENLGQVAIDISTAAGTSVDFSSIHTPNGVNFYIPLAGSYVVTFTLSNGDEYYGEFEVTD